MWVAYGATTACAKTRWFASSTEIVSVSVVTLNAFSFACASSIEIGYRLVNIVGLLLFIYVVQREGVRIPVK